METKFTNNHSEADILIYGHIFTSDANKKFADAIAIKDEKIIFVGDKDNAKAFIGPKTEVKTFNSGELITAGLVDAHTHINQLMISNHSVSGTIKELASKEEIIQTVKDFVKANPNLNFYVIKGWENLAFAKEKNHVPTYQMLDGISNKPILCVSSDVHSYWVNKPLLDLTGVTKDTPNPYGGFICKDCDSGEPLGVFTDTAQYLVDNVKPKKTPEIIRIAVKAADDFSLAQGYTARFQGIENEPYNLTDTPCITYTNELDRQNQLHCYEQGSFCVHNYPNALELVDNAIALKKLTQGGNYEITSLKIFLDGIIENAGAYLSSPYEYWPEKTWKGYSRWEGKDSITKMGHIIAKANKHGLSCHFHCMGDEATSNVLDAIELAVKEIGIEKVRECRNSIAHLALVKETDFKRFHDLNVVATLNPWCNKDPKYYRVQVALLGKKRADKQYPMKSFVNAGVHCAFGTDLGASFTFDSVECFHALTTRLFNNDDPESLLNADERLSREETLLAMTLGGAYQLRREHRFGSLEVGKDASLVVFSKDLLTIPENEIMSTKVVGTMFKGNWYYKKF